MHFICLRETSFTYQNDTHTHVQEINQFMSGHPTHSLGLLFTLTKEACEVCHEPTQEMPTRLSDLPIEMDHDQPVSKRTLSTLSKII